jgi:hypothetical protein
VGGGEVQVREISGGSGYCSQNSMIAGFGFGDLDTVDSVQVLWPSGLVSDTALVATNQVITIVEFDIAGVEIAGDRDASFMLFPSFPNPFEDATTIRYTLAEGGPVALRVYDVAGRAVKTLVDDAGVAAGEHIVRWNGDNDTGAAVASGVYFYRIEAGPYVETRRMVLLR